MIRLKSLSFNPDEITLIFQQNLEENGRNREEKDRDSVRERIGRRETEYFSGREVVIFVSFMCCPHYKDWNI